MVSWCFVFIFERFLMFLPCFFVFFRVLGFIRFWGGAIKPLGITKPSYLNSKIQGFWSQILIHFVLLTWLLALAKEYLSGMEHKFDAARDDRYDRYSPRSSKSRSESPTRSKKVQGAGIAIMGHVGQLHDGNVTTSSSGVWIYWDGFRKVIRWSEIEVRPLHVTVFPLQLVPLEIAAQSRVLRMLSEKYEVYRSSR